MDGNKSNPTLDFQQDIMAKSHDIPIVVQFSAPSCGPCIWVEKQWVQIRNENTLDWLYFSLPLEDYIEESKQFNITSNPTSILVKDGKVKGQLKGALPKMVIEQWLQDQLR